MPATPNSLQPVLHVTDLKAAIEFYTGVLACTVNFEFGGFYAGLALGEACFHLSQGSGLFNRPVGGANVYFMLDTPAEVDAYYAEIKGKGCRTDKEPQNYPYGMRDFVSFDPDGNMLSFGAETVSEGS